MHVQPDTRTVETHRRPPDLQMWLYQCECSLDTGNPRPIAAPRPSASSRLHTVWRRAYGGMDTDAAKELKELREQNARLKRLLADAELEKTPCGRSRRENSEPSCQAPRRRHAHDHVEHVGTVGVQSGWAGPLHVSTPAGGADPGRSRRRNAGLAARLRQQTPVPWVPARLGGTALRR